MSKIISIFSTKTLDEKGCLFDCKNITPDGSPYVEIISGSKSLIGYFMPSVNEMLGNIRENNNILEKIREMIINKIVDNPMPTKKDLDRFNDFKKNNVEKSMDEILRIHINNEIKYIKSDNFFDSLCERIITWELKNDLVSIINNNQDNKEFNNRVKDANIKALLYHIKDTEVYAVHCLEGKDKDCNKNSWIPTLANCAASLANGDKFELNLILHDKDLGNDTEYTQHDVMPLLYQEVQSLLPVSPKTLTECHITFFKHTTNACIKLLRTPCAVGRNIEKEVTDTVKNYLKLDLLEKISVANIECNVTDFNNLKSKIGIPAFQYCEVGSIKTVDFIEKELKAILNKLANE